MRIKTLILIALSGLCVYKATAQVSSSKATANTLVLYADKPAADWMSEAYPLGNGRIGAMVYGGVKQEHIQINELSLWTGDEKETGAYQAFGDLFIDFDNVTDSAAYSRKLDLNDATHRINYQNNGVAFTRKYFCSFPDKVLVLQYTSAKKGAYSATISLKDAHGAVVSADGSTLTINGALPNELKYSAGLTAKVNGGKWSITKDKDGNAILIIKNADAFTLMLSAATNYSNQRSLGWHSGNAADRVIKALASASKKTVAQLQAAHVKDYQTLSGRVSLRLGNPLSSSQMTTAQRIAAHHNNQDTGLEALLFQYGRYLLISSSRKGGLPANLQGIWNNSNNPPWRCDYHSNINIQMNYWLAEPTNLTECHFPYLDYINSMREVKKERTKEEYPGVRGWTVKTENNIFGGQSFVWNTPGSAWYVQNIWEHYAFSKDLAYLKTFGYPILKEIVEFWDDHLKRRPDGTLVAPNGWSPEHGPTEDGVTHDQEIIYDLFTNYIEAGDILKVDKSYRDHVADMRAHLLMPKIGRWGQLQEWETDRDDPNDTHRHVSHLFALHPGRQISPTTTPKLAEAARVSLQARGDESTGWSMAWKMNFWARLHDGNHAYKILNNFITLVGNGGVDYNKGGGIYANMLCSHPPFQIDGNFGYTAGVAEMLIQSQTGDIELLPALPEHWQDGEVKGLKARGNFEIAEMSWKNGKLTSLTVKSLSGGKCTLRLPNSLNTAAGKKTGKVYSFNTTTGKSYSFRTN